MKFLNKLDNMTIRKAPRHFRAANTSAKSNSSIPVRKNEFNIEDSYHTSSQPLSNNKDHHKLLTGINILNNSISGGHHKNSNKLATATFETFNSHHPKLFKNRDSIKSIIKSLRIQKNKNEEEDNEFLNFLVPNIGIKLP